MVGTSPTMTSKSFRFDNRRKGLEKTGLREASIGACGCRKVILAQLTSHAYRAIALPGRQIMRRRRPASLDGP
jgi:hypothetical protein